ncbi:hypothetical protein OC844_001532 [Tilletia horrida]|nr:hypothetical protein OC844_001532 [Tilletia horrida]
MKRLTLFVPASSGRSGSHGRGRDRARWRDVVVSPRALCLVSLSVQNAALAIVMHHSRVSVPPEQRFHTATAVLLVELLKGAISLAVAFFSLPPSAARSRWATLFSQIGSQDCLKLGVPAALYVLQQRLQYTAAANLDPTTFTVSYQMKILSTALFSLLLLRTRIHFVQWVALVGLALGVASVQTQSLEARQAINTLEQTMQHAKTSAGGEGGAGAAESFFLAEYQSRLLSGLATPFKQRDQPPSAADRPYHAVMNPFVGFLAVGAACMTSGFAGVYFEMLLKGRSLGKRSRALRASALPLSTPSKKERSDALHAAGGQQRPSLWIRNVQLSLLSLPPALFPVVYNMLKPNSPTHTPTFAHITTPAALLTIAMQVLGGLLTALVIKHADNILKGFAVACSVLLSFAWSLLVLGSPPGADGTGGVRFNGWFVLGSALTIGSTFLYNRYTDAPRAPGGARRRTTRQGLGGQGSSSSDEDEGESLMMDGRRGDDAKSAGGSAAEQGRTTRRHSNATALQAIQTDPALVSSVWHPARHSSFSSGGAPAHTCSGRSHSPPSPHPHRGSASSSSLSLPSVASSSHQQQQQQEQNARRSITGSSVAPRLIAEAGAAWATVLSYSQIPLATTANEDEDVTADEQSLARRGRAYAPVQAKAHFSTETEDEQIAPSRDVDGDQEDAENWDDNEGDDDDDDDDQQRQERRNQRGRRRKAPLLTRPSQQASTAPE